MVPSRLLHALLLSVLWLKSARGFDFANPNPPTFRPTTPPTVSPATSPTVSVTASPTASPTAAPINLDNGITRAPTASPTASPTKSSTDTVTDPTASPTANPTKNPVETVTEASTQQSSSEGVIMALSNVSPLSKEAQETWKQVTTVHIVNEIMNAVGVADVELQVNFKSQDPPLETKMLRQRLLDDEDSEQLIFFDAFYAIEAPQKLGTMDSYIASAFNSQLKRSMYLERLAQTHTNLGLEGAADVAIYFEAPPKDGKPTDPNVEDGQNVGAASGGGDSTNVGTVVGVILACIVVVVVGASCYVRIGRDGRKRAEEARSQAQAAMQGKDEGFPDGSSTADDDSIFSNERRERPDLLSDDGRDDSSSSHDNEEKGNEKSSWKKIFSKSGEDEENKSKEVVEAEPAQNHDTESPQEGSKSSWWGNDEFSVEAPSPSPSFEGSLGDDDVYSEEEAKPESVSVQDKASPQETSRSWWGGSKDNKSTGSGKSKEATKEPVKEQSTSWWGGRNNDSEVKKEEPESPNEDEGEGIEVIPNSDLTLRRATSLPTSSGQSSASDDGDKTPIDSPTAMQRPRSIRRSRSNFSKSRFSDKKASTTSPNENTVKI